MPNSPTSNTDNDTESLSLAQGFKKYFNVQVASTKALRHEAFKIRHNVYCEELNWENLHKDKIETDEFDDYSYHIVLQHLSTQTYAGSVRVIIPPPGMLDKVTPFELNCLGSIKPELLNMDDYPRGSFGEVSRIAVPTLFRRRPNEAAHPYLVDGTANKDELSAEERRQFPNIAIGLYLSAVAMVDICQHRAMFVMVEPRLSRHLARVGLPFEQVGEVIDYHGKRALFRLSAANFSSLLKSEMKQLYQHIILSLREQMTLLPYGDPLDK